MTKKYYLISGVVIVILITLGISFFIKRQKPTHFLYQSLSKKIPEDFLIVQNQRLNTNLIFQTKLFSDEFYCKTLDTRISRLIYGFFLKTFKKAKRNADDTRSFYSFRHKAEKIEYLSYSAPSVVGAWRRRYAVVCGNNYWIVDGADSWGVKIYGPFKK